ncbi:HvfC/BufC N-terminal domain-containing protein [Chitinophaga japonensis]|uniref:Uncharacterized protein n=1 Tax=Chitinophaga japonensis TaxID=104662 RepID=A0A562SP65_CHIJA|nr:putative DNA-binding domain-containing protein [Chitinophaga japonensis]TWI82480.1 hypothetical protein LX66_5053 [Chitinophaga japonensis]
MPLSDLTRRHQSALASYCRTGQYNAIPGVHAGHVTHYRRLVYNVVDDMLQSAYPLTHHLLKAKEWKALVQEFFSNHPCQSPQVWYMPGELYQYMLQVQHPLLQQYDCLQELLWLEWTEVELFMMEDRPVEYTPDGDLLTDALVLNPEHRLQRFRYPVHLKPARQITANDQGDYFLVLYRKPDTGEVSFLNLSPVLAHMLELLAEGPQPVSELIRQSCAAWQLPLTPDIEAAGSAFFSQALESGLIPGFKIKKDT